MARLVSRGISQGDVKRGRSIGEQNIREERNDDRRIRRNLLASTDHARTDYPSIISVCSQKLSRFDGKSAWRSVEIDNTMAAEFFDGHAVGWLLNVHAVASLYSGVLRSIRFRRPKGCN